MPPLPAPPGTKRNNTRPGPIRIPAQRFNPKHNLRPGAKVPAEVTNPMPITWLVIAVLVTWRITHLVVAESGPWRVLERTRRALGGNIFGQLLDCFYCSSLWIAAPIAFLLDSTWLNSSWLDPTWVVSTWKARLLLWPALSAGAILIERSTHPETFAPTPLYIEDSPDSRLKSEHLEPEPTYSQK
jgi:hypothetical protein